MKSNAQLKTEAKALLQGRWTDSLLLCLIPILISCLIAGIFLIPITVTIAQNGFDISNSNMLNNNAATFIGGLFSAIFTAGISWTFLDMFRGKKERIEPFQDAFRGFKSPFLLAIIGIYILSTIFISLWLILLVIPAIIKSYAYAQAYNIYYDTFENTGEKPGFLDSITASRRLMNGYKGQLFLLDLSFIGWHILAIASFGIGYLWLTPYIAATKAAFYNNLPKTA